VPAEPAGRQTSASFIIHRRRQVWTDDVASVRTDAAVIVVPHCTCNTETLPLMSHHLKNSWTSSSSDWLQTYRFNTNTQTRQVTDVVRSFVCLSCRPLLLSADTCWQHRKKILSCPCHVVCVRPSAIDAVLMCGCEALAKFVVPRLISVRP